MAAPTTEQKRAKGIDPQVVRGIAAELGETTDVAQILIKRIVRTLGEERTRELVRHAGAGRQPTPHPEWGVLQVDQGSGNAGGAHAHLGAQAPSTEAHGGFERNR
jgi:hypothetical protein